MKSPTPFGLVLRAEGLTRRFGGIVAYIVSITIFMLPALSR